MKIWNHRDHHTTRGPIHGIDSKSDGSYIRHKAGNKAIILINSILSLLKFNLIFVLNFNKILNFTFRSILQACNLNLTTLVHLNQNLICHLYVSLLARQFTVQLLYDNLIINHKSRHLIISPQRNLKTYKQINIEIHEFRNKYIYNVCIT